MSLRFGRGASYHIFVLRKVDSLTLAFCPICSPFASATLSFFIHFFLDGGASNGCLFYILFSLGLGAGFLFLEPVLCWSSFV